jgi:hypothetical protein
MRVSSPDRRWCKRRHGGPHFDCDDIEGPRMQSFAAFFGCRTYISRHVSSHDCAPEEINRLLVWALLGAMRFDLMPAQLIQYLTIIEILLRQGADPNSSFYLDGFPLVLFKSKPYFSRAISAWGVFIMITALAITQISRMRPEQHTLGRNQTPEYLLLNSLMKLFFSCGADVNTSVISDVGCTFYRAETHLSLTLEEPPLSILERRLETITPPIAQDLSDLLSARGAVRRRRCRMIHFRESTRGIINKPRVLYWVSQDQSNCLCEAWPWAHTEDEAEMTRKKENLNRVLEEIKASLTEADKVPKNSKPIMRSSFKSENGEEVETKTCSLEQFNQLQV